MTFGAFGNTFGLGRIHLDPTLLQCISAESVRTKYEYGGRFRCHMLGCINKISADRSTLGALQQRLNFTSEQLIVTKENLSAANSRIADTDVQVEATEYARGQILVQSGTAMLAQANSFLKPLCVAA